MTLRSYWNILKRRWVIALIPALLVGIIGVVTYSPPPQTYNTGVRFIVSESPDAQTEGTDEQRYFNFVTSEYIVNTLADWVRGNRFAEAVSQELAADGLAVPPGAIGIAADHARSVLTLSINHSDPELLAAIMQATIKVFTEQNGAALPQLGGRNVALTQLDTPSVNPVSAGIRSQLDLPLRLILGAIVGLGLAFLVEYFDPTIREKGDVPLPLLGEIPKK